LYNEDGSLKSVREVDDDTQAALCGMEVEILYDHFGKGQAQERGTLTKIKLADRGLNLERLGRHFKLFTNRVQDNGLEGLAERLQKARERAQK
jgi:phage terminase small subunit